MGRDFGSCGRDGHQSMEHKVFLTRDLSTTHPADTFTNKSERLKYKHVRVLTKRKTLISKLTVLVTL